VRLRAQIRGPVAARIHINVKQELSQVQSVPLDEYQARIHLIANQSEGVPQMSQNRHPSCHCGLSYNHHNRNWDCVAANKSVRAPGPGRRNWFEPSYARGMHAADSRLSQRIFYAADIETITCEPRACQKSVSQQCAWRQIPLSSILGCSDSGALRPTRYSETFAAFTTCCQ
jgi:hypothetical protein